jgi:toxin ParE1/3/4
MRLAFAPMAVADIESIGDFIADDSPEAARRFVDELRQRCARILNAPLGGTPRPELGGGLRSVPFGRYVIFHDVEDMLVTVQRVLHSARDIGAVFSGE